MLFSNIELHILIEMAPQLRQTEAIINIKTKTASKTIAANLGPKSW